MTEYRVVKHYNTYDKDNATAEADFKDYDIAKAVFESWNIGDKDLNGYEVARVDIYEIVDGEIIGRCNAKW